MHPGYTVLSSFDLVAMKATSFSRISSCTSCEEIRLVGLIDNLSCETRVCSTVQYMNEHLIRGEEVGLRDLETSHLGYCVMVPDRKN